MDQLLITAILNTFGLSGIFGYEMCFNHVEWALDNDVSFLAPTPISIFGSMGVVKWAIVALQATLEQTTFAIAVEAAFGETLASLLINDPQRPVVKSIEHRIRKICATKRVHSVKVEYPNGLGQWNQRLMTWTAIISTFAAAPYIFLIPGQEPRPTTWQSLLFPILRVYGTSLLVVSVQFILQYRFLQAINRGLQTLLTGGPGLGQEQSLPIVWRHANSTTMTLCDYQAPKHEQALIYPRPTSETVSYYWRSITRPGEKGPVDMWLGSFALPPPKGSLTETRNCTAEHLRWTEVPLVQPPWNLVLAQLAVIVGLFSALAGFIGCLHLASSAPSWGARFVSYEVVLLLVRAAIWCRMPKWGDAGLPVALEKVMVENGGLTHSNRRKCSYGIGWALDSVTPDDISALIIGVDELQRQPHGIGSATEAARSIEAYLGDVLFVPRNQICTLLEEQATRGHIVAALDSLRYRSDSTGNAPIIIYFAGQCVVSETDGQVYLVVHPDKGASTVNETLRDTMFAYGELVELLQRINEEGAWNIMLILDLGHGETCSWSGMGEFTRYPFEDLRTDYPSHTLLAGVPPRWQAGQFVGERFTRSLLNVLHQEPDLTSMTYETLVSKLSDKTTAVAPGGMCGLGMQPRGRAILTTFHRNSLLLNGLFARRLEGGSRKAVVTIECAEAA